MPPPSQSDSALLNEPETCMLRMEKALSISHRGFFSGMQQGSALFFRLFRIFLGKCQAVRTNSDALFKKVAIKENRQRERNWKSRLLEFSEAYTPLERDKDWRYRGED